MMKLHVFLGIRERLGKIWLIFTLPFSSPILCFGDNDNENDNDNSDVPPLLLDEREPCRQVPWVPHISSQALNAPLICEVRLEKGWSLI